ncbi:uncharacterized protein LOC141651700 [Silene latifolia]|uniref:uncharacterized protein LOC141651700 n=1 Tax=Silene latifolia TaxID=37657 RepID=UPI003D772E0B
MLEGWCVTTNCNLHKGGRVWILWQPSIFDVWVLQYDPQFIHVKVTVEITQKSFFLSMIYAYNEGVDRKDLWTKLENIASNSHGPWVMAGDFNMVISPDERMGGNTKQEDMDDFIDCITTCRMTDIHATGAYFTWTNKQDAAHRKFSRLDRFMVNQEWLHTFPEMAAHFHPEGLLDHNPCVVRNTKLEGRKNASFKYFNMWSIAPDFLAKVQQAWSIQIEGNMMFRVAKRLKNLKGVLKGLNRECYTDIENKASQACHELERIQLLLKDDTANADLITREINVFLVSILDKLPGIVFCNKRPSPSG